MGNGVIDRLETATKIAAATKCGLTKIPTMDAQALLMTLNQQEKVIESLKTDLAETLDIVTNRGNVVRCKDCDNKECWGRAGDVVCGIDGTPHRPDWFCADGIPKEVK